MDKLWRHLDFRRLWIGETVSQFGTMISELALPLTAILVVHASTFQVGLLSAFQTVAFAVVSLPAGAWVERMRFRHVLIVNDLIRAAALASIPIAQIAGVLTIWQLYAVALVTGVSTVFFDVAYQSYLPRLIGRQQLVDGNAKLQASESVSQLAGPSAGGLLIQALTAPFAVLIDAASFVWSAAWVTAIRFREPRPERTQDRNLRREIRDGLRFVTGNPMLRAIAICTGSSNLFSSMSMAVFYVLLARDLHVSPGLIGLITSAAAIGGLAGALSHAPFVRHNWTLVLLAVAMAGVSSGIVVYNITQVSFRQGLCPPTMLGRMNATMRFLVWGTMPAGSLLGGVLGTAIGVRETLFVAAAGGSLTFLPVFLSPLRRMRQLPSYAEHPAAEASPGISAGH